MELTGTQNLYTILGYADPLWCVLRMSRTYCSMPACTEVDSKVQSGERAVQGTEPVSCRAPGAPPRCGNAFGGFPSGEAEAWFSVAPPPPPVWGVAFLRLALVQHGSAVVHHFYSGTAAAGEAGIPRWGSRGCGCCAVRGRRGRPRARNRGRGGRWNEEQTLGLGIQGLEEELPE